MTSIVIVDSGPLVAAVVRRDPHHAVCARALQETPGRLVLPAFCVAEASYLIGSRYGAPAEARFLRGLSVFDVEAPAGEDWPRAAELVERYRELPLGGADAALVALAERLRARRILTLDRRHFNIVQPSHCERFELLP